MKAKHIIKGIVFMLAIALMTPGVFAQTKVQKEKKEQNIKQIDRSKIQKLEVEKEIPNRQQDVRDLGKPTFDRFGNPTGFQKPGSNSSSPPPKSELQEKWAETNCGKQPYGDFYEVGKNPCPSGYRLPTENEFKALRSNYKIYYQEDKSKNPGGVAGCYFGASESDVKNASAKDMKGCIFLPLSGRYINDELGVYAVGTDAYYGTSTSTSKTPKMYVYFDLSFQYGGTTNLLYLIEGSYVSVRCVKK